MFMGANSGDSTAVKLEFTWRFRVLHFVAFRLIVATAWWVVWMREGERDLNEEVVVLVSS